MSAPEYCRVAKEEDKASSVSPLAAPSVSNSLEETQLLETPPENDGTKWQSGKVGDKKSKYSQEEATHADRLRKHYGLPMLVDVCRLSFNFADWK